MRTHSPWSDSTGSARSTITMVSFTCTSDGCIRSADWLMCSTSACSRFSTLSTELDVCLSRRPTPLQNTTFNLLPAANEVCEGYFSQVLSVQGGSRPSGSLSIGVFVQGVSVQVGGLCPSGSLSRGGLCPGGLCPGRVSVDSCCFGGQ